MSPSLLTRLYLDLSPGVWISTMTALPLALFWLKRALYPVLDPREPPVLRPKIPYVGHSISIFKEGGNYYGRLYDQTNLPVCTLPLPGGKLYLLNSAALISAGLRSPTLSFDPFIELFSRNALGVSAAELARFRDPAYVPSITKTFFPSLSGEPLRAVTAAALRVIADGLNEIGSGGTEEGWEVAHVGDWLREVISRAVVGALYGEENPITGQALQDVWDFDEHITILTMGLANRFLTPRAIAARSGMQAALRKFYAAGLDQGASVSAYVRNRAANRRRLGASLDDLVAGESDIPWTALTNTIPSLAWVFLHVFAHADYAERVRREVLEVTTTASSTATINASLLEKQPFITACVNEVQRVYNKLCGYRLVTEDTVLQDADGRAYLLKEGASAQWFHGVPHLSKEVWGEGAAQFDPARFVDVPADEEKKRRVVMIPFGGGKTLCPGRRFAVTEIMGMVSAVALLFEVEGVRVPEAKPGYAGCAMAHPAWGKGDEVKVRFRRREGWKKTEVQFTV